jgi:NAD(P)-dependent dehydrogenase (short-subunit alcohol dehydrogenase family)
MGRLTDKVAIIAGAGTGIGEAVAKKFAAEGAQVLINSLDGDPIDDVVESIKAAGGNALVQDLG